VPESSCELAAVCTAVAPDDAGVVVTAAVGVDWVSDFGLPMHPDNNAPVMAVIRIIVIIFPFI
jgi:hypothetical protein